VGLTWRVGFEQTMMCDEMRMNESSTITMEKKKHERWEYGLFIIYWN
jgi:hypothetical protein